jgi:hypothetical protein
MIATKLLRKHMPEAEREHEIDKLIENLKSNLFFHGHPINRKEAKQDLKIKVHDAPDDLEPSMWELYEQYATELKFAERLNPSHEWDIAQPSPLPPPASLSTQDIVVQMQQMAAMGIGIGAPGLTEKQLVDLAVAMIPHVSGSTIPPRSNKVRLEKIKGAYVESIDESHVFLTDLTFERVIGNVPAGPQDLMKQEVLWQRWEPEP